jgi:hypothetical protein
MMPVLRDGDAALCVAEGLELLDVERLCVEVEFGLVEGDSAKSTLCYDKVIQLITD